MKYLVDANVLSEPTRPEPQSSVVAWLRRLLARLRATGRTMPIKDSLIAATALTNRLTVVTRNVSDFEKAGCDVVDPFEA